MHPQLPSLRVADVPDPVPEDLAVLDVREPVEWAHGHIAGAVHVPLTELAGRLDEVPDGRLLVVCRVGARSLHAVDFLRRQGRDAVNLDGGMVEWEGAGRPMQSETGRPAQVV